MVAWFMGGYGKRKLVRQLRILASKIQDLKHNVVSMCGFNVDANILA